MFHVAEAKHEKAELKAAAEKLCNDAIAAKRDLLGAELEQYQKHVARIKEIDAAIQRHAELATFLTEPENVIPNLQPRTTGNGEIAMPKAFAQYLRTGIMASADLGPTADGAVLIPTQLYQEVTHREAGFRPMEQVSRIISTDNGEPWKFPRIDDSADGEYLAASTNTGNPAPPSSLDSIQLDAYKASSKPIAVSRELLTDANYDVGKEIVTVQLNRTGRLLNGSFTSGDGVARPTGFLTGLHLSECGGR